MSALAPAVEVIAGPPHVVLARIQVKKTSSITRVNALIAEPAVVVRAVRSLFACVAQDSYYKLLM